MIKPKPILVQDRQYNSETSSVTGETNGCQNIGKYGIDRKPCGRGGSVKLTFGKRPMIKKRVTLRLVQIKMPFVGV